jgi:hypothetical protein
MAEQEQLRPEAKAALETLARTVYHALMAAADGGHLTPRGVLYGAGVGLKLFYTAAAEIEGWSPAQTKDYVDEELAAASQVPLAKRAKTRH